MSMRSNLPLGVYAILDLHTVRHAIQLLHQPYRVGDLGQTVPLAVTLTRDAKNPYHCFYKRLKGLGAVAMELVGNAGESYPVIVPASDIGNDEHFEILSSKHPQTERSGGLGTCVVHALEFAHHATKGPLLLAHRLAPAPGSELVGVIVTLSGQSTKSPLPRRFQDDLTKTKHLVLTNGSECDVLDQGVHITLQAISGRLTTHERVDIDRSPRSSPRGFV